MSEYTPTEEDLVEAFAISGEGADFKRVYWAQREAACDLLAEVRRQSAKEVWEEGARAQWLYGNSLIPNEFKKNPYRK